MVIGSAMGLMGWNGGLTCALGRSKARVVSGGRAGTALVELAAEYERWVVGLELEHGEDFLRLGGQGAQCCSDIGVAVQA